MKLTGILLLAGCLQLSARGLTQTVSISVKDAPLVSVLKAIEKQTGYVFFVNNKDLQKASKISLTVNNIPLQQVLDLCFKNQPLSYAITGKVITVTLKEEKTGVEHISQEVTNINIKGRIVDPNGQPIANATVTVKGTTKTTLTDVNGNFSLTGVNENAVIIITHIQYEMKFIAVNGRTSVNATLQVKVNNLDELQVIAYGTTSKRFNTGNIASVKASEIQSQPVSNPLLALAGRVPGLEITQATGFAGSGVKVRIQGLNSINNGNDPLYVIDGVPYISQVIQSLSKTQGSSGGIVVKDNKGVYGSPLNYINPADIESIEILKDADATAIYGSRAANGAILITTKKGKSGDQRIEFNIQQGWGKVTRKLEVLNLRQYLDMRYEALKNDGIDLASIPRTGPGSDAYYDLTVWDTTRSTDWQKELIGHTAHYTDAQATVSGGTSNNFYSVSTGYHRETTVLPFDFDDKRGSVHFQLNTNSANQKFKLSFIGNYMADVNKLPAVSQYDLTQMAVQLAPNAPALYNADGSINWAPSPAGNTTWDYPGNPFAQLLDKYLNKTNNLVGNMVLDYQIIPGLNLNTSFGYTNLQTNETVTIPLASIIPESRTTTTRSGQYGNSSISSWVIEPQVRYHTRIAKGKLEGLAGASVQQRYSDAEWLVGNGYVSDDVLDDIHAANSVTTKQSIKYTYKYAALFGRVNYSLKNRYIANINLRRDGSSRFGVNNSFHMFGSAGGAWIFSEEPFIKRLLPFLSFGKLKTSYGLTGNDQIGDFLFLSIYSPVSTGVPYQGISALQLTNLSNPYLHWEQTRKLNLGGELGFYHDRVYLTTNFYLNRSSNQLLTYPLSAVAGFGGVIRNFPATVQNSGWEFSLSTTNVDQNNFKWSSRINLTLPSNKLVSFPGIENTSYASSLIVGYPLSIERRFHLLGVDPSTGHYYFDSKTDPSKPSSPNDLSVVVHTSPKLYGGFQNSFSYKNFQLDFLFQFVVQKGPNYLFGRNPGVGRYNQPTYVLDRWQKAGDIAPVQRFNSNLSLSSYYYNANQSDGAFTDASYARLKNFSLSWRLPESLLKPMHLKLLRIFTQGQNLLTVTRYKGLDPETLSSTSLPPLRVLTVGAQVQF